MAAPTCYVVRVGQDRSKLLRTREALSSSIPILVIRTASLTFRFFQSNRQISFSCSMFSLEREHSFGPRFEVEPMGS